MAQQNWFNTLSEALDSEGLLDTWDGIVMEAIAYGENRRYHVEDGTRYGRAVSIYRESNGMYERPVHYSCN